MCSNDKYFIIENFINDIECKHNNIKKTYIGFCLSCKKNFCSWCKKHKFHKIIKFDEIEPSQEDYEKVEEGMKNMQSIDEKIKKCYSEIINFQKTIIEINELINNSLKQLKECNERFNSHLQFKKAILNLYQENKRNYYILSTFNSLDFNLEDYYLKRDKNIQQIFNI